MYILVKVIFTNTNTFPKGVIFALYFSIKQIYLDLSCIYTVYITPLLKSIKERKMPCFIFIFSFYCVFYIYLWFGFNHTAYVVPENYNIFQIKKLFFYKESV